MCERSNRQTSWYTHEKCRIWGLKQGWAADQLFRDPIKRYWTKITIVRWEIIIIITINCFIPDNSEATSHQSWHKIENKKCICFLFPQFFTWLFSVTGFFILFFWHCKKKKNVILFCWGKIDVGGKSRRLLGKLTRANRKVLVIDNDNIIRTWHVSSTIDGNWFIYYWWKKNRRMKNKNWFIMSI